MSVPANSGGSRGDASYCLVATKPVRAGDEVAISYTGPEGATNRSLMARYGFVPAGGNPWDRLELDCSLPGARCVRAGVVRGGFEGEEAQDLALCLCR
jgi:hypothetical protein